MAAVVRVHRPTLTEENREWQLNRLKNQVIKFYKEKGNRDEKGNQLEKG
jgi:hypothetical protein